MNPRFLAGISTAAALAASHAPAQTTHVWSGAGATRTGNRDWTNSENWVGGVPPKDFSNTQVVLSGNPTSGSTSIVNEDWRIRSLNLNMTGGNARLDGEPLTIGTGGIELSAASTPIFNQLNIRRNQTWFNSRGQIRILTAKNTVEFLEPGITAPYILTLTGGDLVSAFESNIVGTGTIVTTDGAETRLGVDGGSHSAPNITFNVENNSRIKVFKPNYSIGALRLNGNGELNFENAEGVLNVNSLQGTGRVTFSTEGTGFSMATLRHQGTVNESFAGRMFSESTPAVRGRFTKSGSAHLTLNSGATSFGFRIAHLELTGGRLILDNGTGPSVRFMSGNADLEIRPGSNLQLLGVDPSSFGGRITGRGALTIGADHSLTLTKAGAIRC